MKFKTAEEHLCEERQAVIDELANRRVYIEYLELKLTSLDKAIVDVVARDT